MVLSLGACKYPLLNYTVLATRNISAVPSTENLPLVEGSSSGFLGLGATVQKAIDEALEKAGPGYDLLINGQLSEKMYYFLVGWVAGYEVKGYAAKSSDLKLALGEDGYREWLATHNVTMHSDSEE